MGRAYPRIGCIRPPARRAVLRRCGDVRSALFAAGGPPADLRRPSDRRSRSSTDDLGVDRRPRYRRHPVVHAGRPHRPGQGDIGVGHDRDGRRPPRAVRAKLSAAPRRPFPRGADDWWCPGHRDRLSDGGSRPRARGQGGGHFCRRNHHRRPDGSAGIQSRRGHRRMARRGLHRCGAVRIRRAELRQARPAASWLHPVEAVRGQSRWRPRPPSARQPALAGDNSRSSHRVFC